MLFQDLQTGPNICKHARFNVKSNLRKCNWEDVLMGESEDDKYFYNN